MSKEEEKEKSIKDSPQPQKEELEGLKKELFETKKTAQEHLDGWKRAQADYANLKRRVDTDLADLVTFANADLISKVLPVLENFRRAFIHIPKEKEDDDWVLGIKQVEKQLEDILRNEGLEKIDILGKEADPAVCEVVCFEDSGKHKDGEVIEEIEAGYKLKGKVIKPVKVKVCKK